MTVGRRILNKERCGYRSRKQRYNVWRAEYNERWEITCELIVRQICDDNGLKLEDYLSADKRNRWEKTYDALSNAGYHMIGQSIRNIQSMGEAEFQSRKQERKIF